MKITQLSIFLENRKGRLADVCELLGANKVNILALNIAETESFGVLRIVVNDPERAVNLLSENGFVANQTHVVAVEVGNDPGGLSKVLRVIADNDVNVEYMYGFMERYSDKALMVFRFEDPEFARSILEANNINIVTKDIIREL